MKKILALAAAAALLPTLASAEMRITEWAYQGNGGEYIEFTNVGTTAIDLTGWSFDDDSRAAGTVSLSGFGVVAAGASVILTEADAAWFATQWGIDAATVIGNNTTNLGRNDEINIYDAVGNLVDRLTYGDQNFPGSPRTQNVSGVYSDLSALGANDISKWVFSTVGDAHGGRTSLVGDVGSVGTALLPVPEPETYALMLMGLATVGAIARRKKA